MPTYRVRKEEVETIKNSAVSYATFYVDPLDDPSKAFARLKRDRQIKWVESPDENENDYDVDEWIDKPEWLSDDGPEEQPIRGNPSDFGLTQPALV
jgi:hypothetical protein